MPDAMTAKQRLFVQEFLIDGNATKAAERAGYSPATARQTGAENLSKLDIAAAIADAQAQRAERTQVNADWVVTRLKLIAERCLQSAPVFDRKGQPVRVEGADGALVPAFVFDAAGANRALELLGKHIGMFKDRVEHTGSVMFVIEH